MRVCTVELQCLTKKVNPSYDSSGYVHGLNFEWSHTCVRRRGHQKKIWDEPGSLVFYQHRIICNLRLDTYSR